MKMICFVEVIQNSHPQTQHTQRKYTVKLTFFSGTPILLENDLKPFLEGTLESLYRGVATFLEEVFKKILLLDIAIMKSTTNYIVGHFLTSPLGRV